MIYFLLLFSLLSTLNYSMEIFSIEKYNNLNSLKKIKMEISAIEKYNNLNNLKKIEVELEKIRKSSSSPEIIKFIQNIQNVSIFQYKKIEELENKNKKAEETIFEIEKKCKFFYNYFPFNKKNHIFKNNKLKEIFEKKKEDNEEKEITIDDCFSLFEAMRLEAVYVNESYKSILDDNRKLDKELNEIKKVKNKAELEKNNLVKILEFKKK